MYIALSRTHKCPRLSERKISSGKIELTSTDLSLETKRLDRKRSRVPFLLSWCTIARQSGDYRRIDCSEIAFHGWEKENSSRQIRSDMPVLQLEIARKLNEGKKIEEIHQKDSDILYRYLDKTAEATSDRSTRRIC